MKLKQYLTEESLIYNGKDIWELIQKDCKPYMKFYNQGKILYRGTGRIQLPDAYKKEVRIDRRPSDMPKKAHDLFDEAFKEKFGIKARSESLFCFAHSSNQYGIPYVVFPIGNFKCIWNPNITDLYDDISSYTFSHMDTETARQIVGEYVLLRNELPQTKNELMIVCKEYYAIKASVIDK